MAFFLKNFARPATRTQQTSSTILLRNNSCLPCLVDSASPATYAISNVMGSRGIHDDSSTAAVTARLAKRIPKGTWDTHMHVVEPDRFPLDKDAAYRPAAHTLDQAKTFLGALGIENMVIVQPSIYGNDNACTLEGTRRLGPSKGRAVIQFDPEVTTRAQLQEWHDMGARAVRVNFVSVGASPSAEELEAVLHKYANALRPFGWSIQLFIAMEDVPKLAKVVPALGGTRIIIDHFGYPRKAALDSAKSAHEIPGFASLDRLLREGNTWVKLSASYRLARDPKAPVVESLCREIVRARPDRVVFATDWPHTRFDDVAVAEYLEMVLDVVEQEGVSLEQVLVKNAEILFEAKS